MKLVPTAKMVPAKKVSTVSCKGNTHDNPIQKCHEWFGVEKIIKSVASGKYGKDMMIG